MLAPGAAARWQMRIKIQALDHGQLGVAVADGIVGDRNVAGLVPPIVNFSPARMRVPLSCARKARKPGYSGLLPFMPRLSRAAALVLCLLAPAGLLTQPRHARVTLTFALTRDQQSDLDRL